MGDEMARPTLNALRRSIRHWRKNAEALVPEDVRSGAEHCALCSRFSLNKPEEDKCIGCPVMLSTGHRGCVGSPYHGAVLAQRLWGRDDDRGDEDLFRAAAREEVDFLVGLLPKEKGR